MNFRAPGSEGPPHQRTNNCVICECFGEFPAGSELPRGFREVSEGGILSSSSPHEFASRLTSCAAAPLHSVVGAQRSSVESRSSAGTSPLCEGVRVRGPGGRDEEREAEGGIEGGRFGRRFRAPQNAARGVAGERYWSL